ncbi:hypothetical protein D3C86_1786670 [compost metagenome]
MAAEQQAAECQHGQLPRVGTLAVVLAEEAGEQGQGDDGEDRPAADDGHGQGIRQLAEDPRQAEQQRAQVNRQQCLALGHARREPLGSGLSKLASTTLLPAS